MKEVCDTIIIGKDIAYTMKDNNNKKQNEAGAFGKGLPFFMTFILSLAAVLVSATQIWIAYENNKNELQLNKIKSARTIISKAGMQLGAKNNNEIDLHTRLVAIASLKLLSTIKPPLEYYEAAADLLEIYIRLNLATRKTMKGEEKIGVKFNLDRECWRAEDIDAAIIALQKIRTASKGKVQVKLKFLDFSFIDLDHRSLEGFDLSFSKFRNAAMGKNLRHTIFDFADLYNVALWNTDMSNASFHKTKLTRARFVNVNLTGTNIEEAKTKDTGIFVVSGLKPEQSDLFSNYKKLKAN